MDYKDLANLIFPDAKPISYYEEKYPERNLPEGAVVTRFAPSPTGFVHLGSLYQSLIARTVATKTNGVYFLRIEDTDQKREVENGVSLIVKGLADFGIVADEGMTGEDSEIGEYGPYIQSKRKDIYQAYAKHLIEEGLAYPCFMSQEELDEMRKKQEAAGVRPGYYGVWAKYRTLPVDEAAEKIKAGEPYIIRFKSPGREDKKVRYHDVIKGNVEFPENDIDLIIIKSDGLPTYHFASVCDDHLMHTNMVIRGDEWLSSMPTHIQLYGCMGFKAPKFAHIAPIMKNDEGGKRKLSKRKDPEANVEYYTELGVPKDAIIEYLYNIANSNFEGWRKGNKEASINDFDFKIDKMSVSGDLYDIVKILDISKTVISRYDAETVYNESLKWAKVYDEDLAKTLEDKEYALKVFGIERENQKPRKDIAKWSDVKANISYMYEDPKEYDFDLIAGEDAKKIAEEYIKIYDENDDNEAWFNKVKDLAENCGYAREVKEYKENPDNWPGHVGDVSTAIRVIVTGRRNTPNLCEIMKVLGKDTVIRRLENAIKNI